MFGVIMKQLLFMFIFLVIFFFMIKSEIFCDTDGLNEKVNFIIKLMDNPNDCSKIIIESHYYSDDVFGNHKKTFYRFENWYIEQLKNFKNKSIMSVFFNDSVQIIHLIYLGDDKTLTPYLTFIFTLKNNSWVLQEPELLIDWYIFSQESLDFYNNFSDLDTEFKFFRSKSSFFSNSKQIINYDSSYNFKMNIISKIIKKDKNLNSFIENNYNDEINSEKEVKIINDYLINFTKVELLANYPCPYSNEYLSEEDLLSKDYFVLSFFDDENSIHKYLTIEFKLTNGTWKINQIYEGIYHYLATGGYGQYIEPNIKGNK